MSWPRQAKRLLRLRVRGYKSSTDYCMKEMELEGREERSAVSGRTVKEGSRPSLLFFSVGFPPASLEFLGFSFNFFILYLGSRQLDIVS